MPRTCRVSSCTNETASRYSAYCPAHKTRLRRHGSADQRGIGKADFAPYLRRVEARRERNTSNPLWGQLEARWSALEGHARAIINQAASGQPGNRYELRAARELLRIIEGASSRQAIDAALAMFMMQELEPRRFRSDRAFWAQLVRRVRGVADVSVGRRWDHRAGRVRRVYSEVPPKALEYLQAWIVEAFGMAGLRLAELEAKELGENARQREQHQSALKELK